MNDLFNDPRLTLTSMRLHGIVGRPIIWNSHPGSVIHGVLGMRLKTLSCVKADSVCKGCNFTTACAYSQIVDSPRPPDAERMRLYPHVPSPLRIVFNPWEKAVLETGSNISLGITLVGEAQKFASSLLFALGESFSEGVGRKGKDGLRGTIQPLEIEDTISHNKVKLEDWRFDIKSPFKETQWSSLVEGCADVKGIYFTAPTRIVSKGKVVVAPTIRDIMSTAMRRISSLAYFHCGVELEADFPGLLDIAQHVNYQSQLHRRKVERFSGRQQARMNIDGILGWLEWDYLPEELAVWLRLSTYVGVGKGTTTGLGDLKEYKK